MKTINELEGMELAAAVAEAQGMTKQISRSGHAWFDTKGELWTIADKSPDLGNLYRPDLNIAQAWELLDGFVYSIDNHEWREDQDDDPVGCCLKRGGWAEVASGHTASVAICRAFLKAKAAQ